MYEQSADEKVKEMARKRLLQLDSLDQRDGLRKLLTAYQTRIGKCPNSWKEIEPVFRALRVACDASGAPLDPTGVPYVLRRGACEVDLDPKSVSSCEIRPMRVIEITNLTKDYEVGFFRKRKVRALDGLSLSVDHGQIFGFLGANGAGKTTTLKLLMRLIFPTTGSARILGHDIQDVSMHQRIGYLPENPYFYDYLTAREFLDYCGEIFGLPAAQRKKRDSGSAGTSQTRRETLGHATAKVFQRNASASRVGPVAG